MKVNKEDRWLLVSCLRKSIRKGFSDLALNYADKLYELEKDYLLYRLSLIAIEDIGLGNLDLVHDFLSTELKKAKIEARGGKKYIMQVVEDLSLSVKDRSACDLTSLASFYQEPTDSSKTPEQIFLDINEPIVNRALAGWKVLGGKKYKNSLIGLEEQHNFENFFALNQKIVKNPKVLEILRYANSIHKDPHFIMLGLLHSLYNKDLTAQTKMGKYITGQYVQQDYPIKLVQNKWLIDGIDWHTKEGRDAIFELTKCHTGLNKYFKTMGLDNETFNSALGLLLFRQNGHHVDKRLVYPASVNVLKTTQQQTFKNLVRNDLADFSHALKLFENSVPVLNEKIKEQFVTANPQYFPF
jgi:hypothetical protein